MHAVFMISDTTYFQHFCFHVSNYYMYQINTCIWIKFQEAVGDTLEELWISYNNIEKLKGINVLKRLKVMQYSFAFRKNCALKKGS